MDKQIGTGARPANFFDTLTGGVWSKGPPPLSVDYDLREEAMEQMNRRSALALGVTAAATPLLSFGTPAVAATYAADEGKELFPGVRAVELGDRPSMVSAYKTISMLDVVFQPGAVFPEGDPMEHDMVCHVSEGELQVKQGDMEFPVKTGEVWSCGKGSTTEGATNTGSGVSVMRVIYLKAE